MLDLLIWFREDTMRVYLLLSVLLFSASTFSQSLEAFHKRFKQVRDDNGKLIAIKDKHLMTQFLISPFIKKIIEDIKEERRRLLDSMTINGVEAGELREEEIELFVQGLPLDEEAAGFMSGNPGTDMAEVREAISNAIKNLKNVNIDSVFNNLSKTDFVKVFQSKMQKALFHLSLNTVAATEEPRYFYRKNAAHEAISFGLKFAKDRLSSIPLLNFASYMVIRVGQLLHEQRNFSQHMLMYYVDNFSEKDLGLTKEEVDKVMSSVFESRISWTGYNESNYAVENWMSYGWDNFYKIVRKANRTMKDNEFRYLGPMTKVGFNFAQVKDEEDDKIINLLSTAHMFTSRPASAFYINKPYKILIERRLLNLAEVGINFLPIPGWVKNLTESVLSSFYKAQAKVEGSLAAHFEAQKNYKNARIIYQQSMNPFILLP